MTPSRAFPRVSAAQTEAVILCAGLGKRLRPLTLHVPKALVPVGGRPLLDLHLEALAREGVSRTILVVGHLADKVREHVGDGRRFGLSVEYVTQELLGGTGDALRVVERHIRSERMVVIYPDAYFGPDPDLVPRLFEKEGAKIAAAEVPDAGSYGRLKVEERDGGLYLLDIQEKDGRATPGLINAGAYLLPRGIFRMLERVGISLRGELELTDAVVRLARELEPVRVVKVPLWVDIGTPEQLVAAQTLGSS